MILGLHHAALSVPDFSEALGFCCGKLGFEPLAEVDVPGGIASMSRALGIEDSACKLAMLKKGNSCIEIFDTPPEGAAPMRWAYCRDPFGNVIELLEHWPKGPTALSFDA